MCLLSTSEWEKLLIDVELIDDNFIGINRGTDHKMIVHGGFYLQKRACV